MPQAAEASRPDWNLSSLNGRHKALSRRSGLDDGVILSMYLHFLARQRLHRRKERFQQAAVLTHSLSS